MNNLLTKPDKEPEILYKELENIGYKQFEIYNSVIEKPLQKIWLKLDNVNIYEIFDDKLIILLDKNNIYNSFISKIEIKIQEKLTEKYKIKSLVSQIQNQENFYPKFNILYSQNNTPIFNNNGYKTKIKMSNCNIYIELNKVFIINKILYFSWCVLQCIILDDIDFTVPILDTFEDTKQVIKENNISNQQHFSGGGRNNTESVKKEEKPPKVIFNVSPNELLSQITRLKKKD